jgi:heme exporter protein D
MVELPTPFFVAWLQAYLGKYAAQVVGSYAFSLILIVAIVVFSVWRSRRVRRALAEAEERAGKAP